MISSAALRSPRSRVGAAALALVLLAVPVAGGSVDPGPELFFTVLLIGGAAAALLSRAYVPFVAVGLIAVGAGLLVQLVPLPAWMHGLSPGSRRVFEAALSPLGAYPAARPLSLDVGATAREVTKLIGCLAAFLAAAAVSDTGRRRLWVARALGASSGLVASCYLGAAVLGREPVYSGHFPFVNSNHLAAHLVLTGCVALGVALRARGAERLLMLLSFVLSVVVIFLSLSRAGMAAFFLGMLAFLGLSSAARGHSESPTRDPGSAATLPLGTSRVLATVAVAVGLSVATYLALGPVLAEVSSLRGSAQEVKFRVWGDALRMLPEFAWLGTGRGAFSVAFPPYASEASPLSFHFVENEWLQVLLDLGLPVGLVLIGTLGAIWLLAAVRRDFDLVDVGLLAGTAAVSAHALTDFSLEFLGVAVPFSVAMGLLTRARRRVVVTRRAILVAAAFAAAAAPAGTILHASHGDVAVEELVAATAPERDPRPELARAMAWRPGDHLLPLAAGNWLSGHGKCGEALPWLVTSMGLAPMEPLAHLLAARCLAGGRRDADAWREYRLAYAFGHRGALKEAADRYPGALAMRAVVPDLPDSLIDAGVLLLSTRPQLASDFLVRALDDHLDDRALVPLARIRLAQGDLDRALQLADRETRVRPRSVEGYRIAAEALSKRGSPSEAWAVLQRGVLAVPGSASLLSDMAERALAANRPAEARRLSEEIAPISAQDTAIKLTLAARALAAQERLGEAIAKAESALAAAPDSGSCHLLLLNLLERAHRYDDAIRVGERLAALPSIPRGSQDALLKRLRESAAAAEQERWRRAALGLPDDLPPPP